MEYNERIKQQRTQKNVTQQKLADELGVSRQSVVRWENGWSVPSMYYAQKLASYFGISVTELMTGVVETPVQKSDRDSRIKYVTTTARFCVVMFLWIVVYTLANDLIDAFRYYFVHTGDTYTMRFTIGVVCDIVDWFAIAVLAVALVLWMIRLAEWLSATDDKFLWYRTYKMWNIGLVVWLITVLTVVFVMYVHIVFVGLLFVAAVFIAVPVDFVVDVIVKRAFGKRMVAPRNKTLNIINCVYCSIAAVCSVGFIGWIIYAALAYGPSGALAIGFSILYFCIGAVVVEISYVVVRAVVYIVNMRKANGIGENICTQHTNS